MSLQRPCNIRLTLHVAANIVTIPADRVKEILALNKQGVKVDRLVEEEEEPFLSRIMRMWWGRDSLTRFR